MFKAETGKTPYDYLIDVKKERTREMLKYTDKTVTEVCYACGFRSSDHFSPVFKRKVGASPSQFRKILVGQ